MDADGRLSAKAWQGTVVAIMLRIKRRSYFIVVSDRRIGALGCSV